MEDRMIPTIILWNALIRLKDVSLQYKDMIKIIKTTKNVEILESLRNKKVCSVEECPTETVFGPGRAWKGSTENEFFYILFIDGMLSLYISEREMLLEEKGIGVGMTPELQEAVDVSKIDKNDGLALTKKYTSSGKMDEDMANITLDDILETLDWKLAEGVEMQFRI